jgi:hypothetical protein
LNQSLGCDLRGEAGRIEINSIYSQPLDLENAMQWATPTRISFGSSNAFKCGRNQ